MSGSPQKQPFGYKIANSGHPVALEDYQKWLGTNASCYDWPTNYFEDNQNISQALVDEVFAYGRENLALVHLFIQQPYYTKVKRDVAMTLTSYIANSGGLLGLCLGFSFLSGIEILYWCCRFTKAKVQQA